MLTMWYGSGRTRKTSRVAGPAHRFTQADRRRNTTDKGSFPLGDSTVPDALDVTFDTLCGHAHRIARYMGTALVIARLR